MKQTNILIVEDERVTAFDLKLGLERQGYTVVALVASGEQAIDQANRLRPDIVLMDIHLKGSIDGIEAAARIQDEWRIPVIFLTAYAEEQVIKRAEATLPFGYLTKPCNPRELHAMIKMALARRAAEIATERSEERLRLALDAAELGVWEFDVATGQFNSGGHLAKIFQGTFEPIGESWDIFLERVHPEDRSMVSEKLKEALVQESGLNLVFRQLCAHGETDWIEVHAKTYAGPARSPMRLVGVIKSITERRAIEERLRQASIVYETIAEGIVVLDSAHRIISVNPAFTLITGYRQQEVLGQNPDKFLHARPHSDQFYKHLEGSSIAPWQGEIYCRHKRGEVFPAWQTVNVVRDSAGNASQYVAAFSDISAMRRAEQQLTHLAHHDPLTGLPNRLLFNDRLDQVLKQASRKGKPCAVLFLDLDNFKIINDSLGHAVGDLLLQSVAVKLQQALRRSDTVARLGGDEFVIIMTELERAVNAAVLSQKLLDALAQPVELAGQQIAVSASIGLSIFPNDGVDRHALLKAADTAMYNAKVQGRNSYCFYTQDMAVKAAERMSIEQGLRRALEKQNFVLHYQPLVALQSGSLEGVEALIRWEHPQLGLIPPERFVALAEETGLIRSLGEWVLLTACVEASSWARTAGPSFRLSVNVSACQFARPDFNERVRRVLEESGFPPAQLELEITESTLQVIESRLLEEVKELGVKIAIDDFGTGYSCLSALKNLPIDRLKIDRSFVQDISHDCNDLAIVEAIMALSRTLHLQITAEGIEDEMQLSVLCRLGCKEGQGYLFSPPIPSQELQDLITKQTTWTYLQQKSDLISETAH